MEIQMENPQLIILSSPSVRVKTMPCCLAFMVQIRPKHRKLSRLPFTAK